MERLKIVSVENKTEVGRLHAICRGSFKRYYPGFDGWYRAKVLPGIGSSRWVLKAISGDRMAGICIVKDDGAEKKICSLRVDANHRGRGVGTAMIAASIELLDDERPLITVPQEVMPSLSPLLEKFGFEAMAEYRNLYREGASEFFYNGTLASSTGIAETFDVRSSLDLVFR